MVNDILQLERLNDLISDLKVIFDNKLKFDQYLQIS